MIPAGTYTAKARGFAFGVTANDKDYVAIDFEISGPQCQGEVIGWRGYFSTEGAIRRTLESLKYAGWTGAQDTIESLPGLGSAEVELVIQHEDYEGKTYPRVQWVNKLGRGGVALGEEMDAGRKRTFAARLRGHVAALNAPPVTGGRPAQQRSPDPDPNNGAEADDVPF